MTSADRTASAAQDDGQPYGTAPSSAPITVIILSPDIPPVSAENAP